VEGDGGAVRTSDPWWNETKAGDEAPQPAAAPEEELGEVLPVGPDEGGEDEDEDDEEMLSQRERVRRREARAKERAERREEEESARRRRKRRSKRAFNALAEAGRARNTGRPGYRGSSVNAGVGCGIAMLVVGFVIVFLSLLVMSGSGRFVAVVPVGLIVAGIVAIARGMSQ
jgi:hypothetical protein